jgi:hypothetical protein
MKDTLFLKYYSFGTWNQRVVIKGSVGEPIEHNRDSVWMNVVGALRRTELPLKIEERPEIFYLEDWYSYSKDSTLFKEKILSVIEPEDSARLIIVPIVHYYSAWKNEINAGLTMGSVSPSDRLEHSLKYTVYVCVIYGNEMKYFNASAKFDTLTREPYEPYRYHFPQELWDTLVYMSTRDYVERMR